jgi:hypothetical protein
VNGASTAIGIEYTFSGAAPSRRTTSHLVNSEIVITAAAACTTRGTARRL